MPLNATSVPSRTISLPVSQAPTPTSPFRTGAASYPTPNSPLISSAPLASLPNFRPMPNSRVPLISHAHPSHPQEPESSSTKKPPTAKLGPHMARMAGPLAQPSTIINAIASGYHAPTPNASSTPSLSSQKPSHFPNLPIKTPRIKPPGNSPTPYNNHVFADNSPNSMTTTLRRSIHTLAPGVEIIAPGVDTTINKQLPPIPPLTQAPNLAKTSLQPLNQLPYNLRPHVPSTLCRFITHSETGESMEYRDLINYPSTRATWLHSAANKFGRLAQGLSENCVEPTNTLFFIPRSKVPKNKLPTYARFVCSYRPQKAEPYCTHITIGGNLIDYPGNLSMKVADMTTF